MLGASRGAPPARQDGDSLLCLQALWPPHPLPHTAVAAAAAGGSVWTGGSDGILVRWAHHALAGTLHGCRAALRIAADPTKPAVRSAPQMGRGGR
jgi:hypothetical protein